MDRIREIIQGFHVTNMTDPIYMQGYNASPHTKNPYKHPEKTNLAMLRVAIIPTALTDKEKRKLVMWRKRLEKTKWSRWSSGYHAKHRNLKLKIDVC